jgi:uncharacterized protein (DUF1499 family)
MTENPKRVGIIDGKFRTCPKSPKCVSTQSTDEKHKMKPIEYEGTLEDARSKIIGIINSLKRSKIITETNNYIHSEFRTKFWHFIDDVEFYFNDTDKIIHFRSSARFGYYDWGVNKKRMQYITDSFKMA